MHYQYRILVEPPMPMVVEVFKTNITHRYQAVKIIELLQGHFPGFRINMDLSDCDNILRVEGRNVLHEKITEMVVRNGFECSVL